MAKDDNFIINGAVPMQSFGVKTRVLKRTGAIKRTYTIEIRAEPLAVAGSALNMGENLAKAVLESISDRIKSAGSNQVKTTSKLRRRQWGTQASTPSAKFRFNAPTKKLSKAKRKANLLLPPKRQYKAEVKKNARPDDPPDPNATGKFNHSGRLREGIAVIRGRARYSTSKKLAVWSIFVPANRLHEPSFGLRFVEFLNDFHDLVEPAKATQSVAYQQEMHLVSRAVVVRLQQAIREKRRYMVRTGISLVRNVAVAIL